MKLIEKRKTQNFSGKAVLSYIYEFKGQKWKIEKDALTNLWNLYNLGASTDEEVKNYIISLPTKTDLLHFIQVNAKYIDYAQVHKLSLGA